MFSSSRQLALAPRIHALWEEGCRNVNKPQLTVSPSFVDAGIFLDNLLSCVCLCQDPAHWARGAHPGHSPEHVRHGTAGGADPAAQHGQRQRCDCKTHTRTCKTFRHPTYKHVSLCPVSAPECTTCWLIIQNMT